MNSILIAINDLDFGGGQRTVVEEANELHRLGEDVYVVTTLMHGKMGLEHTLTLPTNRIIHFSFRSLFDVQAYQTLITFLCATKPRAIISNLFFTNTVIRVASLFAPKTRIIVREGNITREKSFFVLCVDALLSTVTYRVIGNSQRVTDSLFLSSLFAKRETLYNGIGADFFESVNELRRKAVRDSLHIQDDELLVLSVGSLVTKKGYAVLLDALAKCPRNIRVAIAGSGVLSDELRHRIERESLPVTLLGTRSDVRELLQASDIFILPSLWEGMPNALLEAMAVGLPCIATDVGGVSEVLTDRKNGIVVPANDASELSRALAALATNEGLRKSLGDAGKKKAETLTWSAHVEKLRAMI